MSPSAGTLAFNANGSFSYTPTPNFNGPITFTYRVRDIFTTSNTALVTITVSAVNDPPTISDILSQTTSINTSVGPITFTVGDVDNSAASFILTGASSNLTLVPLANIAFGGSEMTRTVTITPAATQSGTAIITMTVSDGQASTSDSFVLTVTQAEFKLYLPLIRR